MRLACGTASPPGSGERVRPPAFMTVLALTAVMLGSARPSVAEPQGDSLPDPAPASALRELSTDRPDRTESPYTVNAGHLQVEMDLVSYKRDVTASEKLEQWGMAITNLKLGLPRRADLQLVVETRVRDRLELDGPSGTSVIGGSRFGNAVARLKCNLWGNDGGATALALMPFVALKADAPADGGLIVPIGVGLPRDFDVGAMAQVEWDYVGRYQPRWIGSVTVGRVLAGPLAGFVELWGSTSRIEGEADASTFDAGLIYALNPNLRLDTGVYLGLNEASEDVTAFLGVSLRR